MSDLSDYLLTLSCIWDTCESINTDEYQIPDDYVEIFNSLKKNRLDTISNKLVACRAIFDTCAEVYNNYVVLNTKKPDINNYVKDVISDHIYMTENSDSTLVVSGVNLCEIFNLLYKSGNVYNKKMFAFFKLCAYNTECDIPTFRFKLTDKAAIPPKKNKQSDSGFDLVLIKKIKDNNGVEFYDTCVQVAPPLGYYFDLVGRSSISKSGYMLANNIGIIDQSYRGNIIVALVKLNKDMPDLELPCRLVQLIPRKVEYMDPEQVDDLDETSRGDGGFGSSGR
uniref:dUTP diphosphatase n=1 Tax=viral metagenome TaxID=1070528 RepID=A0A6C0BDY0_9ZZZZ